jgi:transposase
VARHQKKAEIRRAAIVFVDESGASQLPTVCRTWAPKGETPTLIHNFNWKKISMMSGITPTGRLYFRLFPGTVRKEQVLLFLEDLRLAVRRHLFVLWDGASPHRANVVKAYLDDKKSRFTVFRLPPYAPDLNPDEKVWSQLKYHELPNYAPRTVKELTRKVRRVLGKIRRQPGLLRSFVKNTIT